MTHKIRGDLEVCREALTRSLALKRTVVTTSASTLTLDTFSTSIHVFRGTATGQILNLGDATLYSNLGKTYFFFNESTEDVIIEDDGGNTVIELKPNFGATTSLVNNGTANGEWAVGLLFDTTLDFLGAVASPGFPFGRGGNSSTGTWLLRTGSVPSNRTGYTIGLTDAKITKVTASSEDLNTYSVSIYEHDGNSVNLTLIDTLSVTASRSEVFTVDLALTTGKQLAVEVSSGSARNLGVDVQITGGAQ